MLENNKSGKKDNKILSLNVGCLFNRIYNGKK